VSLAGLAEPALLPMVAALYVEAGGVYSGLPCVDVWDEARDARLYDGPWPVVAHPPCGVWCQIAPLNEAQYGIKVGEDEGRFAAALGAVDRWGGVLEHPAFTKAWRRYGLPTPARWGWSQNMAHPGWATQIDQATYGCPARKRTWLYYNGPRPPSLDWRELPGAVMVSDLGPGGSRRRGADWQPGPQYADASRTPVAFRDVLLAMARDAF
jgi:hypothetical protein